MKRNADALPATLVCLLATFVLATPACGGDGETSVETAAQSVVYGEDDRQDLYAHPSVPLRELTRTSIVALMRPDVIDATNPMNVVFNSDTLGTRHMLCPTERFRDDPTAAHCSGTLIDDDLVLTAGHCFGEETATPADRATSCTNTRFVFGYYRDSATALHTVTQADVFSCANIVALTFATLPDGRRLDHAIVRLDRSATPRFSPATVRLGRAAIAMSAPLAVIGFGSGIPAKIDSGGSVSDPRADTLDYYTANTDTFAGNSGSGVFDPATRELVGVLVRGATDYVPMGTCRVANRCASMPGGMNCEGESIGYAQPAIDQLCASATSARLCRNGGDGGVADGGATDAMTDNDGGANEAGDGGMSPTRAGCGCSVPTRHAPAGTFLAGVATAAALGGARRARRTARDRARGRTAGS